MPSALGVRQEVRHATAGGANPQNCFRLATGIPGPELRFRILFLPPLHFGIGFPAVGGDTNALLEPAFQRNMLFRRVQNCALDAISRPTASKIVQFDETFRCGKPVKPTASTGFMERAMGIEPTSEAWEAAIKLRPE